VTSARNSFSNGPYTDLGGIYCFYAQEGSITDGDATSFFTDDGSTYYDGIGIYGAFFYSNLNLEATITDSTFSNGYGYKGGAFYVELGDLTLSNTDFSTFYGAQGGLFYLSEAYLSASDMEITNIYTLDDIFGESADVPLMGGIFHLVLSEIFITQTSIENVQNYEQGGIIYTSTS